MLFKIISHQIDINADDFLFPNPNLHHTRGHDKRFLTPMTRIDCYKFSFFPSTISGDSRPDLQGGASREQHNYCCLAIV